MPPKADQETLLILINVGVTKRNKENDLKLLEKARPLVIRLIEKKIFLKPKDEVAILEMGSNKRNIAEKNYVAEFSPMQVSSWDIVEKISDLKATDCYCNWIDALYEAIEYLKENVAAVSKYAKTLPQRKIVMISDFKEDSNILENYDAADLADRLNSAYLQLLAIGQDELDERPADSFTQSETFLQEVLKNVTGRYMTLDAASTELLYYKPAPKTPTTWKANLEFSSLKIPIMSYVKVTDEVKFPSWIRAKNDKKIVTNKQYLDRQRNVYNPDEITKGYKYGDEFHAVSKIHEESMSFPGEQRSYRVVAFTKKAFVGLEFWCNATTRVVFPQNDAAAKHFYSLVQAMDKNNLVALVRKVYNANTLPRMVALFPCINIPDEPWCFVEITLPFAEDRRVLATRPLKSIAKQLTDEQSKSVDRLLDGLQVNETDSQLEDGPSFLPGSMPNPAIQNKWHMLSYRALNPGKPLPEIAAYLKNAFEHASVKEKCKQPLQEIKSLFHLENIIPTKKSRFYKQSDDSQDKKSQQAEVQSRENVEKAETSKDDSDSEMPDAFKVDVSDINFDDLENDI